MKLSIITINYNNKVGLEKTIESVIPQTWRDFEWIIIDGGSTDGSKEVIEKLALNPDANISYWCSEKDKGIYNAMNKGVKQCSGLYTLCLNSGDSLYGNNTLELVFSNDNSEDVIYGDFVVTDGQYEQMRSLKGITDIYYMYKHSLCHQAMFVKTHLLKMRGFDEKYKIVADYALCLRLINEMYIFKYINLPICRYDKTGISSKKESQSINLKERKDAQRMYIPSMVMEFLQKCDNYEQQEDFRHFRYMKESGGPTYKLLLLYFKLVYYLVKVKQLFKIIYSCFASHKGLKARHLTGQNVYFRPVGESKGCYY